MSNSISANLLGRYFDGVATPEERAEVEAWVGGDPVRRAAVEEWRAVWLADAERLGASYDEKAAWARLAKRVGLLSLVRDDRLADDRLADDRLTGERAGPLARDDRFAREDRLAADRAEERAGRPRRGVDIAPFARPVSSRTRIVRWAAAAAVVGLAGAGAWRALVRPAPEQAAVPPAVREYATSRGQRGIVRLPDGTEVMLNVASRLTVPASFGAAGQPRDVRLQGQAYFTVVHDDTRPFTVHTARGITRDIGTRFDVRAYPGDAEERVAVTEGEVAVRTDSAATEVSLREGQLATLAPSGRVVLARDADVSRAIAWTRGRLELDNVTLAEAARRLEEWYDLEVRVTGEELARRRVVGSYGEEPVAQVLGILATAVGARYELRDRTVTFFPRGGRR